MTTKTIWPAASNAGNSSSPQGPAAIPEVISDMLIIAPEDGRTPLASAMCDVPAGNKISVTNTSDIPLEYSL